MNINPGTFNKTIAFYGTTGKKNSNGYPEPPALLFKARASVSRQSGRELASIGTTYSEVTTRFFMRYNKQVTTKLTIVYNNAEYDIKYINNYKDDNKYMEILTLKREVSA